MKITKPVLTVRQVKSTKTNGHCYQTYRGNCRFTVDYNSGNQRFVVWKTFYNSTVCVFSSRFSKDIPIYTDALTGIEKWKKGILK